MGLWVEGVGPALRTAPYCHPNPPTPHLQSNPLGAAAPKAAPGLCWRISTPLQVVSEDPARPGPSGSLLRPWGQGLSLNLHCLPLTPDLQPTGCPPPSHPHRTGVSIPVDKGQRSHRNHTSCPSLGMGNAGSPKRELGPRALCPLPRECR